PAGALALISPGADRTAIRGENTRFRVGNCDPMRPMQLGPLKKAPWLIVAGAGRCARVLGGRLSARYLGVSPRGDGRRGDKAPPPRVTAETELLDPQALEVAARYAGEHHSLALIVSRHDHIVFERYWRGTGFDTPADAQSFTRLLAALAAGAAFSHRLIAWPDEPVGAFISEWSHDARGDITVRKLMQMSSRLARAADGPTRHDITAA